jgi:type IV secretory pathway TrbD component
MEWFKTLAGVTMVGTAVWLLSGMGTGDWTIGDSVLRWTPRTSRKL